MVSFDGPSCGSLCFPTGCNRGCCTHAGVIEFRVGMTSFPIGDFGGGFETASSAWGRLNWKFTRRVTRKRRRPGILDALGYRC